VVGLDCATPTLFRPNNPPALVPPQGSVEERTIQNTALEDHAFHIHNLHFLVVAVDGESFPEDQQRYQDVVILPFWGRYGPFSQRHRPLGFPGGGCRGFALRVHSLHLKPTLA